MMIKKIVLWPSNTLSIASKEFVFDKQTPHLTLISNNYTLQDLRQDMIDTCTHVGVGLAAIQIGIPVSAFLINVNSDNVIFAVNPKLSDFHDLIDVQEGCLSLPSVFLKTKRYQYVTMKYQNVLNNPHEVVLTDLEAHVAQHELEHIQGKMFIDGISSIKKDQFRKKMKLIKRAKKEKYV